MSTPVLKGLPPAVCNYTFGNVLRALPVAAKQPLRKARKVCLTLPTRWKNGIDPIPKPIGVNGPVA
eukprot:3729315-Lingulodinium_polyedra.AAC.1